MMNVAMIVCSGVRFVVRKIEAAMCRHCRLSILSDRPIQAWRLLLVAAVLGFALSPVNGGAEFVLSAPSIAAGAQTRGGIADGTGWMRRIEVWLCVKHFEVGGPPTPECPQGVKDYHGRSS